MKESLPSTPQKIETANVAPSFDQIQISIWKGLGQDIIMPTFTEAFGKPGLSKDRQAYSFKNDIRLSAYEKWAYRILRFPAEESLLVALSPILKNFPAKPNGNPAAQLRMAELAWNFPIGESYREAEARLEKAASVAIPKNRKAKLRIISSEKHGKPKDGAINGKRTFYFHSMKRADDSNEKNSWVLPAVPSWHGKIYAKKMAGIWHLRFETTLQRQALEKAIGKSLPDNLVSLSERLAGLCFNDFWRFEEFDWAAFINAAKGKAEPSQKSSIGFRLLDKLALSQEHQENTSSIWQKRFAKKVARLLDAKVLYKNITAGKFSKSIAAEDIVGVAPGKG